MLEVLVPRLKRKHVERWTTQTHSTVIKNAPLKSLPGWYCFSLYPSRSFWRFLRLSTHHDLKSSCCKPGIDMLGSLLWRWGLCIPMLAGYPRHVSLGVSWYLHGLHQCGIFLSSHRAAFLCNASWPPVSWGWRWQPSHFSQAYSPISSSSSSFLIN